MKISFLLIIAAILVVSSGCENNGTGSIGAIVIEEDDEIFIKDQTGKVWDITHAVKKYGFRAANFRNGLGPYALTPINDPEFLDPGNRGYPAAHESFLVIGTTIEANTRAYRLDHLHLHEIVNDIFGDAFVSVAY